MQHLVDFFSQFDLRQKSSGFHRFKNPLDPSTKKLNAVVNFSHNFVEDHKLAYKASIAKFVSEVMNISMSDAIDFVGIIDIPVLPNVSESITDNAFFINLNNTLPEGWKPLDDESFLGLRCRDYWENRKMDVEKLCSKGWGFCEEGPYFGRTIIPYRVMGKLVYYTARDFIGSDPKYLYPSTEAVKVGKTDVLYNQDALYKYTKGFMVEGAVDAECVGDNCVALGGWKLSTNQISLIRNSLWKELHIIPDKGFELKATAAALYFKDIMTVFIHKIPEHLGKDVNEVGFENIIFSKKSV